MQGRRLKGFEQALGACLLRYHVQTGGLYCFDLVESTMDAAFSLQEPANRTVVVAQKQSRGRGRFGRPWWSEAGGLYASVVLTNFHPDIPYSMLASHALLRCIREHGAEVHLKWVNDVLSTDGRKIAGVLTEERCRVSVIGLGVNINNTSFPPELASQATSVYLETGRQVDICVFLCSVLSRLFPMLDNAHGGGIEKLLARWEEDADIMGRRVKVTGEYDEVSGSIRGINRKTGALRLAVNGELVEVYEGSLSYLD